MENKENVRRRDANKNPSDEPPVNRVLFPEYHVDLEWKKKKRSKVRYDKRKVDAWDAKSMMADVVSRERQRAEARQAQASKGNDRKSTQPPQQVQNRSVLRQQNTDMAQVHDMARSSPLTQVLGLHETRVMQVSRVSSKTHARPPPGVQAQVTMEVATLCSASAQDDADTQFQDNDVIMFEPIKTSPKKVRYTRSFEFVAGELQAHQTVCPAYFVSRYTGAPVICKRAIPCIRMRAKKVAIASTRPKTSQRPVFSLLKRHLSGIRRANHSSLMRATGPGLKELDYYLAAMESTDTPSFTKNVFHSEEDCTPSQLVAPGSTSHRHPTLQMLYHCHSKTTHLYQQRMICWRSNQCHPILMDLHQTDVLLNLNEYHNRLVKSNQYRLLPFNHLRVIYSVSFTSREEPVANAHCAVSEDNVGKPESLTPLTVNDLRRNLMKRHLNHHANKTLCKYRGLVLKYNTSKYQHCRPKTVHVDCLLCTTRKTASKQCEQMMINKHPRAYPGRGLFRYIKQKYHRNPHTESKKHSTKCPGGPDTCIGNSCRRRRYSKRREKRPIADGDHCSSGSSSSSSEGEPDDRPLRHFRDRRSIRLWRSATSDYPEAGDTSDQDIILTVQAMQRRRRRQMLSVGGNQGADGGGREDGAELHVKQVRRKRRSRPRRKTDYKIQIFKFLYRCMWAYEKNPLHIVFLIFWSLIKDLPHLECIDRKYPLVVDGKQITTKDAVFQWLYLIIRHNMGIAAAITDYYGFHHPRKFLEIELFSPQVFGVDSDSHKHLIKAIKQFVLSRTSEDGVSFSTFL